MKVNLLGRVCSISLCFVAIIGFASLAYAESIIDAGPEFSMRTIIDQGRTWSAEISSKELGDSSEWKNGDPPLSQRQARGIATDEIKVLFPYIHADHVQISRISLCRLGDTDSWFYVIEADMRRVIGKDRVERFRVPLIVTFDRKVKGRVVKN